MLAVLILLNSTSKNECCHVIISIAILYKTRVER